MLKKPKDLRTNYSFEVKGSMGHGYHLLDYFCLDLITGILQKNYMKTSVLLVKIEANGKFKVFYLKNKIFSRAT